jgi:hypothetical protein
MQEATLEDNIPITHHTGQPETEYESLKAELSRHNSLMDVLAWAKGKPGESFQSNIVAGVVAQDEFTRDIVVPYRNLFLVYDTT